MKKVLIVDDDYGYRNAVSIAAQNRGWTPIAVSSWEVVKKEIAQQEYSLIISDYKLRNETMLSLLDFMNINDLQIPVIVVSAADEEILKNRALEKGAKAFYDKCDIRLSKLYEFFDEF